MRKGEQNGFIRRIYIYISTTGMKSIFEARKRT